MMNKNALIAVATGSLLASASFAVAAPFTDLKWSQLDSKYILVQHRSGDGHDHGAKGHDGHKAHPGHKNGDSHKDHADRKDHSGHDHGTKDHDGHKDHSGHKHGAKGHNDHKGHSEHKDGDDHKDHPGQHGHGKDDKRSDSQSKPAKPIATMEPKGEHGHGHGADSHGDVRHSDTVNLSSTQMREFEITIDEAKSGDIPVTITRPAEIKFNQDRVAHVVPRVSGVVRSVAAQEGQVVKAGTVMAILDSRELADAKSAYLGAAERVHLADITHVREKKLYEKKIYSEKRYLDAKSALAEREIDLRAASQKLRALGFNQESLKKLVNTEVARLTEYKLIAPFPGTVISRHITRGEAIDSENEAFLLADVSQLWIDITIYPKDLVLVKAGQKITVYMEDGLSPISGKIDFITPHLSEATRTAIARTNVNNPNGRLRPGQFVKARIETGSSPASIRVPKTAIQRVDDKNVVFVSGDNGLSPRKVVLGRENGDFAEIVEGLDAGEKYVSNGAFTLKAQLSKESFGDGHNH